MDYKVCRSPMKLNKLCELEDWKQPHIKPFSLHRKHWEYEHFMHGIRTLGVARPEAWVLAVAGGHESPVYQLTNCVRWVFCTDLYENSDFPESDGMMLRDPDRFAPGPYNRRRLVVQYMNALDLRFEDGIFDLVFSLSSIEHFGGTEGSGKALAEMSRVLRPGGIVALTTEVVVNGADYFSGGNLQLFSPKALCSLLGATDALEPVESLDFSISEETLATVMPLSDALLDPGRLPHIVLSYDGRQFTSMAVFLRKREIGV
jgi:SAM-dependent methyltransferase